MYFSLRHGQNTSVSDRLRFCLRNNLQQFRNPTVCACFPIDTFRGGKKEAQKNSSLTVYHQNFNSIHNLMKIILFSANFKIFLEM